MATEATSSRVEDWGRAFVDATGGRFVRFVGVLEELVAFAIITLGVMISKFGHSKRVIRPMIWEEIVRAGIGLMPMVTFLGAALGLVIIGQTVALLTKAGMIQFIGPVMVTVVVREVGPLLTAILVLARSGTSNAIELGTARALGEIEALESLAIDPILYLVVPRVIGLATAVFCLTTYLILTATVCGYLFAFLQEVPLTPTVYFRQIGDALRWEDFAFLALKTVTFGAVIAIVNCYQGLARPLKIEDVSRVTTSAVAQSVIGCVLIDALFLIGYLLI